MTYTEALVSLRAGMFKTQLFEGGRGEPLLFLHGAGGQRGWTPWLEELSQHFRVIVPLHPGWMRSEGIDHIDDIIDLALYYHELMDELGIESAHIIGHSMGGMLAAEIAALDPSRVRKLILVAATGLWLDEAPIPDFFATPADEMPALIWHNPESDIAKAAMVAPETPEEQQEALIERTKSLAAATKFMWPIPDKGLKKRIYRVKAPTLLIWGASDRLVPPIYGDEFLKRIPGARLVVIPEAGHLVMVEQQQRFTDAVINFLQA